MNFKERLAHVGQKLSDFFARARAGAANVRRPAGLAALPGRMATMRAGRFTMPVIDWEKIYRKAFLYNSIVAVICAYFVADLLVAGLTPYFAQTQAPKRRQVAITQGNTLDRYQLILTRNLFNERGLIPNADVGDGIDGPPVKTSLPLTLLGLIVVGDGTKSVASIDDKGTNQVWTVRHQDSFGSNLTVEKIEDSRVVFLNRSERRREFVELPKDLITATRRAAPTKASGGIVNAGNNRYAIDRKEVDTALAPENFNQILTQARCVPNFEAGRPAGYRCFQIEPGSIYDKLGMKDNDVILSINNQVINDPGAAFNQLTTLKSARQVEISVNRNGQVVNMTYDIN